MPDCHAFCKDMSQAIDEFRKRFDLSREVLSGLGIEENDYEVGIRSVSYTHLTLPTSDLV